VTTPFSTFRAYQRAWLKHGAFVLEYVGHDPAPYLPQQLFPPRGIPLHQIWKWGARIHMEVTLPSIFLVGWLLLAFYVRP
jgi:hypothetical protein